MFWRKAMVSMGLVLFSVNAFAESVERELHLSYKGEEMSGYRTGTLQNEIKAVYPWLDTTKLELKTVIVRAKSRVAGTSAILEINGFRDMPKTIPISFGNDYFNNDPSTYFSVELSNPLRVGNGPWHLTFGPGTMRLLEIIVNVVDHQGSDPRLPLTYVYSSEITASSSARVISVPFQLNRVKEVGVKGIHQGIEVKGFKVYFSDRSSQEFSSLLGVLNEGETHKASLTEVDGRSIQGVEVIAVGLEQNTEPARYQIEIGYYK